MPQQKEQIEKLTVKSLRECMEQEEKMLTVDQEKRYCRERILLGKSNTAFMNKSGEFIFLVDGKNNLFTMKLPEKFNWDENFALLRKALDEKGYGINEDFQEFDRLLRQIGEASFNKAREEKIPLEEIGTQNPNS